MTLIAAGALTIASAGLTTRLISDPAVSPTRDTHFEDVVVGRSNPATIPIKNTDRWKSARFVAVRSSCGCARVTDAPITIPPGGVYDMPITIKLNAYEAESSAKIYLLRSPEDASPARIDVSAAAAPPFPGWPGQAEARLGDNGALVLPLDERAASEITEIRLLRMDEKPTRLEIDLRRGLAALPEYVLDRGDGRWELTVRFGSGADESYWNGPLAFDLSSSTLTKSGATSFDP